MISCMSWQSGATNKYYALEIESVEKDKENIQSYKDEGTTVIIVDQLKDLSKYNIDPNQVELVENDED